MKKEITKALKKLNEAFNDSMFKIEIYHDGSGMISKDDYFETSGDMFMINFINEKEMNSIIKLINNK